MPLLSHYSCLLARTAWLHALALHAAPGSEHRQGEFSNVLAFTVDRLDTWVLKVSIAIPLVCIAGLGLWHLAAHLAGKLRRRRKNVKQALEPRPPTHSPKHLPSERAQAGVVQTDPPDSLAQTFALAGADDPPAERSRRARELLALAREDFRSQCFLSCLDRCKVLAATFPDDPEGAEAKQLTVQIKNDPERLQRACAALEDSLAALHLDLAECWQRKGQPDQAADCFRKIVQCCPGTRQSQDAQERLRQMGHDFGLEPDLGIPVVSSPWSKVKSCWKWFAG